MATLHPRVFEGIGWLEFVRYVLDHHTCPSTLIVCSTRQQFQERLYTLLRQPSEQPRHDVEESGEEHPDSLHLLHHRLLSDPSLQQLSESQTLKLAFCPDVIHLRAYLGAETTQPTGTAAGSLSSAEKVPLLAIFNPIQLHRETMAFSVQELDRTLSIAVEAAYVARRILILAECSVDTEEGTGNPLTPSNDEPPGYEAVAVPSSPWDEEISILNVTTKTFGVGNRGWVGRTVKARDVAGRWCAFEKFS